MRIKDMSIGPKMGGVATIMQFLLVLVDWQGFRRHKGLMNEAARRRKSVR